MSQSVYSQAIEVIIGKIEFKVPLEILDFLFNFVSAKSRD